MRLFVFNFDIPTRLIVALLVFAVQSVNPDVPGVCENLDLYKNRFCEIGAKSCYTDEEACFNPPKYALKLSALKLLDSLPLDEVKDDAVRTVKRCVFSPSQPTSLRGEVQLAAVSQDVLKNILDLDESVTRSEGFVQRVSGVKLFPGSVPLAHRYGGHQFGYWAGQLGDGRAHLLGEYTNRKGERWELQLKGSGKTPYSRSGDGRAVLRSSVREFLCSEAMHFLSVPTSRALSLVVSEEAVWRDQFYNGSVKRERGAVVLRLAPSWFRFGSLEILSRTGELDILRTLLNFVIKQHFTAIEPTNPNKYLEFFSVLVNETAYMIAKWMSVGFAHGVCNTDNFSLLSITIDYGPFGFMESYNPNFVPNSSDDEGRYSIGEQANAGLFNLQKLLEALHPVLSPRQRAQAERILRGYPEIYHRRFHDLFKAKLGLLGDDEGDAYLIGFLLKLMEDTRADFTMTFRQLSDVSLLQLQRNSITQTMWALWALSSHDYFSDWVQLYLQRIKSQLGDSEESRHRRMRGVNPRYVLRNWMAESAIRKAENNDFSEVVLLLHTLTEPFVDNEAAERAGYSSRPPAWASELRVSCSS
ncbi:protein adenylyltransferase SelO-1, mitochondrial-like isoform X2 [Hemibagrus wyckioides]|uniref:protein adenylyltransferase SelO-1, mitochondrial-like isoform X2 n=1 Tax=Hemibagrus wyckioides TaxID=337641 RepID=UPI00266D9322|nr:protein adenylyltransferase SelO-1, mitochondrial-like isoform X2 [Hemibagrus wyckioides]